MKKQHTKALLAVAMALLTGCNKADKTAPQQTDAGPLSTMNAITGSQNSFTFYTYGRDITEADFLVNEHDAADQRFNYVNHAMTLGLLEIYQSRPALMSSIVTEIANSKNKELNLYNVALQHPEINGVMNSIFAERFPDFSVDWKNYVTAHYVYDTTYVPFIGFMNLGTVNAAAAAYVAEPLELNEEKFTQFDDDYPMWVLDKPGGALQFTTVNEQMGYILQNPIVGICNGFTGDDMADIIKAPTKFEPNGSDITKEKPLGWPNTPTGPTGPTGPTHIDEWLTHVKCQINNRYENWGKSEYAVIWFGGQGQKINSNYQWTIYSPISGLHQLSKKVNKNQIGTMLDCYFDVFHKDFYDPLLGLTFGDVSQMPALLYDNFGIGFFEYDWGMFNKKKLFEIRTDASNTLKTIKGNRKFGNEWYFIDPEDNKGYPFMIRNPNRHTSYWSYNKGVLQLHRWNL